MTFTWAQIIVLLLLIVLLSSQATTIHPGPGMQPQQVPQDLADTFGAKCLNGDTPTYQTRLNPASSKWVLFLEGGGWCYGDSVNATIQSCAGRATAVGVSTTTTNDYGGILGSNATTNPDFHSWNAVFIHYCDGASFGSNHVHPVTTPQGKQIWMRGRSNFDAVVTDLLQHRDLAKATEIILTGGSAGGLAVFYNVDHLAQDLLSDFDIKVTGFPDAGFFMDTPNYVQDFQGADKIWNVTGSQGTNANCLKAYAREEQWKCLLAPYLLEHIETPLFVMNSAYDAWQIGNNLPDACISTLRHPCNDTVVQQYGLALKQRVHEALVNKTKRYPTARVGAYVDACYVHEQNVNYCSSQNQWPNCVGWTPTDSGSLKWKYSTSIADQQHGRVTPQQAFSDYYFSTGSPDDWVLIDPLRLQQNPSCIYQGLPPSPPPAAPPPPPTPPPPPPSPIFPHSTPVFYPGLNNSKCYRIPTIIKTTTNILLAFSENRISSCGDNGQQHDLVLRRSLDNGTHWGPLIMVKQGTVPCRNCPAAISNPNPVEMLMPDGSRRILLHYDTMNNPTHTQHGLDKQLYSDDDGLSWMVEGNESTIVYPPNTNVGGLIGPSVGIQSSSSGTVYFSVNSLGSHFLYWTHDFGKTYQSSKPIKHGLNECSIAFVHKHRPNSDIVMNCRSSLYHKRAQLMWYANGTVKTNITYPTGLDIDAKCQGSILNHGAGDELFVSHANSTQSRTHMAVQRSIDHGKTWTPHRSIWQGPSAYSQLVSMDQDTVGLLFECGKDNPYETISFTTFSAGAVPAPSRLSVPLPPPPPLSSPL